MTDELAGKLYTSIRDGDEQRVFEKWHCSSLAECPRAHYFHRLGVERLSVPGAGKMLRWKAGHLMEEAIRDHVKAVYPDARCNGRLESDILDLTGEFDNYSLHAKTIVEIKSVHDRAFRYKKVSEDRFNLRDDQPYINHELQNHGYVLLLREHDFPVEQIAYVYITLDGRIATYTTPVKQEMLEEVQSRLDILNKAWATRTPPECICHDKEHPFYKNTMQYCDYKNGNDCCHLDLAKGKEAEKCVQERALED